MLYFKTKLKQKLRAKLYIFFLIFMNMPTTNYSQYSMSSNITSYLFKEENCKIYSSSSNDTVLNDYEGIPENLLINVSVWIGAMILFTFIRRIGNYGRFGLINIKNKKGDETYFFFE